MFHEIVVAAISLGCFWNSYGGQLVFDDTLAVSGNPDTNPYSINKPWHGVFYNDFWGAPITSASSHKSYRPLCVLCFRLSRIINEDLLGRDSLDPRIFHAGNIILHTVNSLLVYALYRSILSAFKDQLNGSKVTKNTQHRNTSIAFLASTLFSAHPIHCESVASVVGLADLMCSICGLIAIQIWIRSSLHYLKAVRNSPNTTFSYSEAAWYLAQTLIAITIVLIGTLFKETCVTWAAVFGAFDVIMLLPALTERKVSVVITSRTDLGANSTRETNKKTTAVGKPIQTKEGEDADGGQMHDNSNIQDATVLEENYHEYRADDTPSAPLSTTSKKNKQDDTHDKDLMYPPPPPSPPDSRYRFSWIDPGKRKVIISSLLITRMLPLALFCSGYILFRKRFMGYALAIGNETMRRAENPIAYSSRFKTRFLSKAYLHTFYARLLIFPTTQSADYSFDCIPLVISWLDTRNLLSLVFYVSFFGVILVPLALLASFMLNGKRRSGVDAEGGSENSKPADERAEMALYFHSLFSPWVLALTIVVATFLPASGVLVDPGTMVAERLLYMPSIGFCLLLALFLIASSSSSSSSSYLSPSFIIGMGIVAVYTYKTVERNRDWSTEETLFRAAFEVCPRSVKVLLNYGILQRREERWLDSIELFTSALKIDATFCDPHYWIGVSLIQVGKMEGAVKSLWKGANCKYNALDALAVLNQVYDGFRSDMIARGGGILSTLAMYEYGKRLYQTNLPLMLSSYTNLLQSGVNFGQMLLKAQNNELTLHPQRNIQKREKGGGGGADIGKEENYDLDARQRKRRLEELSLSEIELQAITEAYGVNLLPIAYTKTEDLAYSSLDMARNIYDRHLSNPTPETKGFERHECTLFYWLAFACLAKNKTYEAVQFFHKVVDLSDKDTMTTFIWGGQHDTTLASSSSSTTSTCLDFVPFALEYLAQFYIEKRAEAISSSSSSSSSSPEVVTAVEDTKWFVAASYEISARMKEKEGMKQQATVLYTNAATEHTKTNNTQEALKCWTKAAMLAPDNQVLRFNMAKAMAHNGDVKAALMLLEEMRTKSNSSQKREYFRKAIQELLIGISVQK